MDSNTQALLTRVQILQGRLQQATQTKQTLEGRVQTLTGALEVNRVAGEVLGQYGSFRRSQVVNRVSGSLTTALQQIWGPEWSAQVGDATARTAKGRVEIQIQKGHHVDEVKAAFGFSTRQVVAFALWVVLFWLLLQVRKDLLPVVLWDEPMLNLEPERYPQVAALFRECGELGVQVIAPTNIRGMIPVGATLIDVGTGEVSVMEDLE